MARKKKKLAAKYIVRRVLAVLILLALLALAGCALRRLMGPGEQEEPASSQAPSSSGPPPAPGGSVQSGGGAVAPPESASQPEPASGDAPDRGTQADGDWRLVLINPTHAIDQELDIEFTEIGGYKFDSRIADKVRELLAAAEGDGIHLAIISGYRTMERSRVLYQNKIAEYRAMGYDEAAAMVEAAKWVAPPGTSEHHSGLAMDIVSSDYYSRYGDLVEEFENDKEAVWLRENCARFGFILRFPKDKVEITGINYEPWHFRYVGEETAKEIMEKGLCLEEYLGMTD